MDKNVAFRLNGLHSFFSVSRDYENGASERQQSVEEFYRMQHIHQTYDFVRQNKSYFFTI